MCFYIKNANMIFLRNLDTCSLNHNCIFVFKRRIFFVVFIFNFSQIFSFLIQEALFV